MDALWSDRTTIHLAASRPAAKDAPGVEFVIRATILRLDFRMSVL